MESLGSVSSRTPLNDAKKSQYCKRVLREHFNRGRGVTVTTPVLTQEFGVLKLVHYFFYTWYTNSCSLPSILIGEKLVLPLQLIGPQVFFRCFLSCLCRPSQLWASSSQLPSRRPVFLSACWAETCVPALLLGQVKLIYGDQFIILQPS